MDGTLFQLLGELYRLSEAADRLSEMEEAVRLANQRLDDEAFLCERLAQLRASHGHVSDGIATPRADPTPLVPVPEESFFDAADAE